MVVAMAMTTEGENNTLSFIRIRSDKLVLWTVNLGWRQRGESIEKEQGSFNGQDPIPEVAKGDQFPTIKKPHDTASTSFNTEFSLNVPENLRSFRVMESMRLMIPFCQRGNQGRKLLTSLVRQEVNNQQTQISQFLQTAASSTQSPTFHRARSLFKLHKQESFKIRSKTVLCSEVKRETISMSNKKRLFKLMCHVSILQNIQCNHQKGCHRKP